MVAVAALATAACTDRGDTKRATDATTTTTSTTATTATTTTAATSSSAGCGGTTTPATGQTSKHTLTFGGAERTYLLHVPAAYDPTTPTPVVFEFHGFGSSAAQQIAYGDFRPLAERHRFLVVAPDGQGTPRHFTYRASATEADDVAFATALLDRLENELCIDRRRVFATGMSNGGALSSVLACRAPDRFAAVAPVAAFFYSPGCAPDGRPAPIAALMGRDDPIVPYEGGQVRCCGGPTIPAAEDTMARFAERSACEEPPVDAQVSPSVRHRHWEGCAADNAVELYSIDGGGHTWPGAPARTGRLGATTDELVATDTIWAFFTAHPLPPT